MGLDLLILYGSQTGQAQEYAEEFYLEATMKGMHARLMTLNDFCHAQPVSERRFIVFMANTGDGDAPDNASLFWKWIREIKGTELAGVSVALLGLGDSNYATFNNTGRTLEELLPKAGAKWIIPPAFCDATKGNDAVAEPWLEKLWSALEGHSHTAVAGDDAAKTVADAGAAEETTPNAASAARHSHEFWKIPMREDVPKEALDEAQLPRLHPWTVAVEIVTDTAQHHQKQEQEQEHSEQKQEHSEPQHMSHDPGQPASYKNPIRATTVAMRTLTAPDAVKPVVSVHFTVRDARWNCQAGDAFSLICENASEAVDKFLSLLGLDGSTLVRLTSLIPLTEDSLLTHAGGRTISLRELFTKYTDLMHFPKKACLRQLAEYCAEVEDRQGLLYLSSRSGSKDYMSLASGHASIMDFLHTFSSCRPPLECILSNLPLLHPRYYSVCSATSDDRVEFIYSPMTYEVPNGTVRAGVCSSWLDGCRARLDRGEALELSVFPRPSPHFRLPDDPAIPVIMICAGTGVAPFIGFLRTMRGLGVRRRLNWLFYGFRSQRQDFLFRDELGALVETGTLTTLSVATSREDAHPRYVQDCLRLHSEAVYDLMTSDDSSARIYICGDELTMIKDVNVCIQEMLMEHGGMSDKEALALITRWNSDKRIVRDIWV